MKRLLAHRFAFWTCSLVAMIALVAVFTFNHRSAHETAAQRKAAGEASRSSPPRSDKADSVQKVASAPAPSAPVAAQPLTKRQRTPEQIALAEKLAAAPGAQSGKPWEDIPGWSDLPPRERLIKLLSHPFGINDRGRVAVLELARDELYVPHQNTEAQRLRKMALLPNAEAVIAAAEELAKTVGIMPQLVLYPPGGTRNPLLRRVVSEEIVLASDKAEATAAAVRLMGFGDVAPLESAPGFVLVHDRRFPGSALVGASEVSQQVAPARPMLAAMMQKRSVPNDPLFSKQWHLRNTKQVTGAVAGIDVNVVTVWDQYQGSGVTIGVIDDGVEGTHPDLSANFNAALSYDYVGADTNPAPETDDDHGTSVAGVAAARGNNGIGVSGAAPLAGLVGFRLLGANQTATTESQAFAASNNVISIKNNSWGPPDAFIDPVDPGNSFPVTLGFLDPLDRATFQTAVTTGRGGKGTIFTFASGNGGADQDQSNKDGYANCIFVNAIGAVTAAGTRSSYSEVGANLIACAPSNGGADPGIATTDRTGVDGYNQSLALEPKNFTDRNYTNDFGGTSSASPLAAGVIALMLEANPNLGWRDVKEILLRSGRKVSSTDTDWISRTGGKPALPLIKHNHKYGGGMVDALAATSLAKNWVNLGTMSSIEHTFTGPRSVPDNNTTGTTVTLDFSGDTPTRVEQIEVALTMTHGWRGDVQIDLISPGGVTSRLASKSSFDDGYEDAASTGLPRGYPGWTFTSMRHWGEGSKGAWRVVFKDLVSGDAGVVQSVKVKIYGEAAPPVVATRTSVSEQLVLVGGNTTFSLSATGFPDISYVWKKGTTAIAAANSPSLTIGPAATTTAAIFNGTASNVTGTQTLDFRLGVVTPPPAAPIFNVGSTITLSAPATLPTGSIATYQWKKGTVNVVDDLPGPTKRISGANSATLTILKAQNGDEGNYECVVTMSTATINSGIAAVSIRYKPDIQLAAFPTDMIVSSGPITPINLNIANGTTKVLISGLPSGLTYNTVTGVISGNPNVLVNNVPIMITAYNLAGSTQKTINLTIVPLDPETVGTFDGLVARNAAITANSNYGGSITSLVIGSNGNFTGKLYLAGAAYLPINGRLIATTTADPTATVVITRKLPLLNMTLTFSIDRSNGHLTGTLTEVGNAWTASVEAFRRTPNTGIAARQNFWLEPGTVGASVSEPTGASAGYAAMSSTGAATVAIKMADGIAVSKVTSRGQNGDVPFFAMMYSNKGSVHGKLSISDQANPAFDTVSGTFTWNKTAASGTTDKTYISGFDFGVGNANALTATGGEYRKPISPIILWGLNNVAVGQVNAKLTFTSANIETSAYYLLDVANINRTFRLTTSHLSSMPLPNLAVVTCTVNATTGEVSGKLSLKDGAIPRTVNYYGVIASTHQRGRGWFTLPQLPVTTVQAGGFDFNSVP